MLYNKKRASNGIGCSFAIDEPRRPGIFQPKRSAPNVARDWPNSVPYDGEPVHVFGAYLKHLPRLQQSSTLSTTR